MMNIKTLAILLAFSAPAAAQSISPYYTDTWLFTGICNSADQVYTWSITGRTTPGTWHLAPWTPNAITIRSIELTKISGGPNLWFMAGNNAIGDAMGFMGPSEDHVLTTFPDGTGKPFPGTNPKPPASVYLDLHGGCTGGAPVEVFYTVGYTIP